VATGAVSGIVWFDRNTNGRVDPNEWPLPGVTVTLGATNASSLRGASSTPLAAFATPQRTAVSASDGSYAFTELPAGTYEVTAHLAASGFEYTSDTDGLADWVVAVPVVVDQTGIADFAGIGKGEVVGTVYDTATGSGLGAAVVTCRWFGLDDTSGTADDVDIVIIADTAGHFDLTGMPYGSYTCGGVDAATGRQSAPAATTVMSATPVQAPLPIVDSTPATTAATTSTTSPAPLAPVLPSELPVTGSDPSGAGEAGAALVAAGIVLLTITRRRRITRR